MTFDFSKLYFPNIWTIVFFIDWWMCLTSLIIAAIFTFVLLQNVGKAGGGKVVDDKTVKASIINKYSFIDNDEDCKEHRPLMPKWVS